MARTFPVRLGVSLLATFALTIGAHGGDKAKEGDPGKPFTAKGEIVLAVHKVKMEKGQLYFIEVQGKGFQPRVVIPGVFLGFGGGGFGGGGFGGGGFGGGGFGGLDGPLPPPPEAFFEQPPLPQLPPLPPEIQKAIEKDRPAPKVAPGAPAQAPPAAAAQPAVQVKPILQPKPPIFQLPKPGEFRTTFLAKETKEYEIIVLPDIGFGEAPKEKLEYTLTVRQAPKPILNVTDRWTDKDPIYGNNKSHFKPYPIQMKAGETYVIDLVRSGKEFLDPYLYLEDKNKQVVAQDDDSGGNLNARIVYTPKADGEFRIIATTLVPATGEFTLTVRGPAAATKKE